MNKSDNQRKKLSQEKIKKSFISLLKDKAFRKITVSDIVKSAQVNRSTFYANYFDIYDLAEHVKKDMFDHIIDLYPKEAENKIHSHDFIKLFRNIRENQDYYSVLFKLNFDFEQYYDSVDQAGMMKYLGTIEHIDYHIAFFKAGIIAIIRKWLSNGCKETPEEINDILVKEYRLK